MVEHLFSYGTLRLEAVQRAQFGRTLDGRADALVGWRCDRVEITDPDVLSASGERFHPIVRETHDPGDVIDGTVFELTGEELLAADAYEVADYRRVRVTLRSGRAAWAYVATGDDTKPARSPGERG